MSRERWTLDELTEQVAGALAVDYEGVPNRRVRDVPDLRTIRYYTTLGLLDRPVERRGRVALYERRHLLQLVAIKRLQARGATLLEVQQQLVGLTEEALSRLAQLPPDPQDDVPSHATRGADGTRAFWKERAGPATEPACEPAAPATLSDAFEDATPLQGVRLDDDVTLLLAAARALEHDDLQALRAGAAPLLEILHTRRLLRPRPERS